MSVLKYFKTTPVALWGRQVLDIFFFLKFATRSLTEKMKGGCRPQRASGGGPPSDDRWAPPTGATGGPVALLGRPGLPPLYKHSTPIPSSFESKNSTKNPEKKRGDEKGSGESLPDSALVICRLVHLVYVFFHWYCRVI